MLLLRLLAVALMLMLRRAMAEFPPGMLLRPLQLHILLHCFVLLSPLQRGMCEALNIPRRGRLLQSSPLGPPEQHATTTTTNLHE